MKIMSVVGARPQFVKLAPISEAAREADVTHIVVHTGQHYDQNMSQSFFDTLHIPEPDANLGIGSGSHGRQTGAMMSLLDPLLEQHSPDWVLVYGDTNSTLAAAVCAVKMHLPVAHLEAGLRSFNRRMPEEHNRVLTDHAADLCLAPTETAMQHLTREGLGTRAVLVGDVMTDVLMAVAKAVARSPVASPIPFGQEGVVVATIHRPDNTDDAVRLSAILEALSNIDGHVYLAMHPRLISRCREWRINVDDLPITTIEPLTYPQMIQALSHARAVVTDSGGLQKEAYLMGVPCTTIRPETEWVETLGGDWNSLASHETLIEKLTRTTPTGVRPNHFGAGRAAREVISALLATTSPCENPPAEPQARATSTGPLA